MSPRPRTASDAELLEGAVRAIDRVGVMRLTLADVAAEVPVSPGTLVHRFGSKRGLLLSLIRRSVGRVPERFASLRATHGSPYATLLALGDLPARHVQSPQALANRFAFLHVDLADQEFHQLAYNHTRAVRRQIRLLIREAIAKGELKPCKAEALARALQATMNGSLLQWAIDRQGRVALWIRGNLEVVLRPLVRRGPRRGDP